MTTYSALLRRLYAQNEFVIKYDLDAMRTAVDLLGIRKPARHIVLVGGTNGKGSTSAALNAIGMSAGLRVGLYTSPHLVDFRERMRINGSPIAEAAVIARLEPLIERFGRREGHELGRPLSFFELVTLLAFEWFAAGDPLDLAVVEVGMGGRLDATNVLDVDASVLTSVSLDHMAWLGDTVEAIAFEKAPVARRGRPVWIHQASGGAHALLQAVESIGADVRVVDGGATAPEWNHALARAAGQDALARLGVAPARARAAIERGIEATRWPARQQVLESGGRTWLIDGAHNPASMAECSRWLARLTAGGLQPDIAIVAASPGRDLEATFGAVPHWPARVICAPAAEGRTLPPSELARYFTSRADNLTVEVAATAAEAVARAKARRVLVVGSLYLCGGVLAALGETPETLSVYAG